MKTVSYNMAGARNYADEVVPCPYPPEEMQEQESTFYQPNPKDKIIVDDTGLFENDWFAAKAFGRK